MFINRYNIHFFESEALKVKGICRARFTMEKQSGSSFQNGKESPPEKSFADCFKAANERYEKQFIKTK